VQIRQNTRSVRAASAQQVLTSAAEFLDRVAADAVVSELFTRGLERPDGLSQPEQARLGYLLLAVFRRWEAAFQHHRAGTITSDDWSGLKVAMGYVASRPFTRTWWPRVRLSFNAGFRAFIEELQERAAAQRGAAPEA
jgi:hypothetical protein